MNAIHHNTVLAKIAFQNPVQLGLSVMFPAITIPVQLDPIV